MGCITSKSKNSQIRASLESISQPLGYRRSDRFHSVRNSVRHVSGYLETEEDFWGTMPYYVIKNRIKHLALNVKNKDTLKKILESITEVMNFFMHTSEVEAKFQMSTQKFSWINEIEDGSILVRAIGLKVNEDYIEVMQGVTQDHLKQKLNETKFAFQEHLGCGLGNKTI
jgi:hypothetical protein